MAESRKCGTCRYWEPLHSGSFDLADHQSGTCSWLSCQIKPMWLHSREAIIQASTLAGAGERCEVWRR